MQPPLSQIVGDAKWPHAPPHYQSAQGTYFVTAATQHHARLFNNRCKIRRLHNDLLEIAEDFSWRLEAWAVFSNHYHFIAKSPAHLSDATSLSSLIRRLHSKSAIDLNRHDRSEGRRIWHNYWDTRLTFQQSWMARLKYVKNNAVHHGLVRRAHDYPRCSAAWFQEIATRSFAESVERFQTDRLNVRDDFECAPAL